LLSAAKSSCQSFLCKNKFVAILALGFSFKVETRNAPTRVTLAKLAGTLE
jgi:hypothetical protein